MTADAGLLALLDRALAMTEDRSRGIPVDTSVHAMFASLRRQLDAMRAEVAAGEVMTVEQRNSLTLGVIAVREFEADDPEYCDVLCDAVFRFRAG